MSFEAETDGGVRGRPAGARRSKRKKNNQIRLGDEKILLAPAPEDFVDGSFYGPNWERSQKRTTILRGDSYDLEGHHLPGSWVVTLSGRLIEQGPLVPPDEPAAPAVAVISIGTGGITQEVEVDAWRGVIALPSNVVKVGLAYHQLGNQAKSPTGRGADSYFAQVGFTATMHRSYQSVARPLRSYPCNFVVGSALVQAPVPPLATEWTFISPYDVAAGSTDLLAFVQGNRTGPLHNTLDVVPPEVVATMIRMHCFRPLPSGAENLRLVWNGASVDGFGGTLIYRIGL